MHHYPFHVKDYQADTAHLSNDEDLCYRRLLDLYYDTEQPIPLETNPVARRLRLGSDVVAMVLQEFFIQTENGWLHARCDDEIRRYQAKAAQARLNGKSGGRGKKTKREPNGNRIGSNPQPKSKANQEPRTNSKHTDSRFAEFWNSYPVKKGKAAAEKAYAKSGIDETLDSILQTLKAQVAACRDLAFFPHASTWLNGKRWEDEAPTQPPRKMEAIV